MTPGFPQKIVLLTIAQGQENAASEWSSYTKVKEVKRASAAVLLWQRGEASVPATGWTSNILCGPLTL